MDSTGAAQSGDTSDAGKAADGGGGGASADASSYTLNVTHAKPPATADLSMLGPTGFAHWGRTKATDVNLGAANQAPFGMVMESLGVDGGTPTPGQFTDNRVRFSWTNGTPTVMEPGTTTGIYSKGTHPSFVLTFVADTTPHQALLFLGGNSSHAQLTVKLGTGAGDRTFTDLESNTNGPYDVLYTIDYAASTANAPLVVSWEMLVADDQGNGNVSLSAIAIK